MADSVIGTDAHQYFVNLTGVANAELLTLKLTNVQDSAQRSGDISRSILILAGGHQRGPPSHRR